MSERPQEPPQVSCEICLKEIPASEATSAEAEDYVLHFCGIDCFKQWQDRQGGDSPEQAND